MDTVSPAPAGMIPRVRVREEFSSGEPRTRGDDPGFSGMTLVTCP